MKISKVLSATIVLLLLTQCSNEQKQVDLQFSNDSQIDKTNEIIEINITQISKLDLIFLSHLEIIDNETNNEIVYQLVDVNKDKKVDKIIFQTNIKSGTSKSFTIKDGGKEKEFKNKSKVYAKFVPERKDDFAWENDKIAFRMYGPALEADGEISNGIDVWVKSTNDLILDKWYKGEDYHTDHGEGLDYYKVGPSLGAGGSALWENGKLNKSGNFVKWEILANGPVRTAFELTYAPRKYKGTDITEIKRITLDAGKNLNKIDVKYIPNQKDIQFQSVIGVVKHSGEDEGEAYINKENGIFGYWEPTNKEYGNTAVGIVIEPDMVKEIKETDEHYLVILNETENKSFTYYAGASWSKSGNFKDASEWIKYLEKFESNLNNP